MENFWSRVNVKPNGCWNWKRSRTTFGYGQLMIQGKRQGAHRVAYMLAYGSIPEGKSVLHTCDNPPCCNPDHLYAGTPKDNARDTVTRGRAKGLFQPGRVRPEEEVTKTALANKGRKHTEEARAKISAQQMGKKKPTHPSVVDPEYRKAMSERMKACRAANPNWSDCLKGRPRSEETRRKISEGHKRRKASSGA